MQIDMFTGEEKDTRTRRQKELDRARSQPKQIEMFKQAEIAQFGVFSNPRMDIGQVKLLLIAEDPRTPEEVEADLMKEAQSLTDKLFGEVSNE